MICSANLDRVTMSQMWKYIVTIYSTIEKKFYISMKVSRIILFFDDNFKHFLKSSIKNNFKIYFFESFKFIKKIDFNILINYQISQKIIYNIFYFFKFFLL